MHCSKAIRINPRFAILYNNLASVQLHKGLVQEALKIYKIALTLEPTHVDTIVNSGNVNKDLGKYKMQRSCF